MMRAAIFASLLCGPALGVTVPPVELAARHGIVWVAGQGFRPLDGVDVYHAGKGCPMVAAKDMRADAVERFAMCLPQIAVAPEFDAAPPQRAYSRDKGCTCPKVRQEGFIASGGQFFGGYVDAVDARHHEGHETEPRAQPVPLGGALGYLLAALAVGGARAMNRKGKRPCQRKTALS